MSFNRYQPNPWVSGAPPNHQVMSGLMTTGYQQPTGPQNHFAPNPTGYNLASGNGINWNIPGPNNVPNGQLRMGQQTNWNQNVIAGQQRGGNQRTPNKRTGNWNNDNHQIKRQNKGTPNQNRNNAVKNNQNRNQNLNNRGNMNRANNNSFNQNNNRNNNNQKNNNSNNKPRRNRNHNRQGNKHQVAQRAAQNLNKKEYSIKKAVNLEAKNEDFDVAQNQYVITVFGYCCKLCDVFLKDKAARNEHVKEEDHLTKFKAAEEEKKVKKLAKTKAKDEKAENGEAVEQTNGDNSTTENGNEEQNVEEENEVENEEEDEEQADEAVATDNGNEEDDAEDTEAETNEVTEESKNLQQSIQADISTESTVQKKGNQAKNKNFTKQPNVRGAKAGRGGNRGARGGNRGKRN